MRILNPDTLAATTTEQASGIGHVLDPGPPDPRLASTSRCRAGHGGFPPPLTSLDMAAALVSPTRIRALLSGTP